MNALLALVRLIHVFGAIFWAGAVWYFAVFLLPRLKAAGPDGGKMMPRLTAPPFPAAMSLSALVVALSGLVLFWSASGGFEGAWMGSRGGIVLSIGVLAGLAAAGEGLFVSRPASERMAALGQQVAAAGGAPSPEQATQIQALARKLERAIYRTAYLQVVAVAGMTTARYL